MRVIPSLLEFLRGAKAPRCSRCGEPILQTHRWRLVYHRFLFFRWSTQEHRQCLTEKGSIQVKQIHTINPAIQTQQNRPLIYILTETSD